MVRSSTSVSISFTLRRYDAHLPLLEAQFSAPILPSGKVVQDGACDFYTFSTGRRALASLHTTTALLPRHDALLTTFNFLWTLYDLTYTPRDEIQLDFTLLPGNPTPPFVWGIIKKDEMAQLRRARWDLVRVLVPGAVPPVLRTRADFHQDVRVPAPSYRALRLLRGRGHHRVDPQIQPLIPPCKGAPRPHAPQVLPQPHRRCIFTTTEHVLTPPQITDQPSERPYDGPLPAADRERHVILTLHSPPSFDAAATTPLVAMMFALIDLLDAKLPLRPETKAKLKTRRDEVDEDLRKEAQKERNDEQEENKRVAKRKAEEDKVSKLSPSEQKKVRVTRSPSVLVLMHCTPQFEEKERKKALRKQQGKMVSRK